MDKKIDRIMTKKELMELLRISNTTFWRRKNNKELPPEIIVNGHSYGYLESIVLRWIEEHLVY